jgi:hypothetical protein
VIFDWLESEEKFRSGVKLFFFSHFLVQRASLAELHSMIF